MTRDYSLFDGCDYHPKCMTCPLVAGCRFDFDGGLNEAVKESIAASLHLTDAELIVRFKRSPRMVDRIRMATISGADHAAV